MEKLIHDLRYSLRSLSRQPAFAVTAILTLAVGVGAATAIFSVINAVMLRPLALAEPDRIVSIRNYWKDRGRTGSTVSGPDFVDWEAQSRSFSALAWHAGGESTVSVDGVADYALAHLVTPRFFEVLGVTAAAGRLPSPEEWSPGGPPVAVITDAYWQRQFGRRPDAIGRTITASDQAFTIIGVLPPNVQHPARADVYVPSWIVPMSTSRSAHNFRAIGRLRDGVSVAQAQAEMAGIAERLERQYPGSNANKGISIISLHEQVVGATRQPMLVLFTAVGLLLLIACANVANLLLARATARQREMVVRSAVGASRGRLVRQLLTESVLLGVAAGALGIWLARLGVRALVATAPATLPRTSEIQVDAAVLLFAAVTALAASLLFGLAPALHVSRVELTEGLRQGGKGTSIGSRGGVARRAFVVAQVALAVVLVVGAALLARSLAMLAAVDMGFTTERLLVLQTQVPVASRAEAPRATAFYRALLAEIRTLPGIEAVGAVTSLPTAVRSNGAYQVEGRADLSVSSPQGLFTVTTPGYFSTLRAPLARGRDFTDSDTMNAPMVAIINESLAREAFPNDDPIGRRIRCGLDTLEYMTIVGVVADIRTAGPAEAMQPEIYMPYEQHPGPATALNLVVRARTGDPLSLGETIQKKIRARNADVPVKVTTMEGTIGTATAASRFQTYLLVVFAGVALALALAGVYGVMTYTVSQRVPELGVRIALGATRGRILRLVLGQGAVLASTGLAVGVGLAFQAGRVLEGLLFGVTSRDPVVLMAVTLGIAVATFGACYLPGRRASRVDPMVALRAE